MAETYYYLKHDGIMTGPFTVAGVLAMRNAGCLHRDYLISNDKLHWKTAGETEWLFRPEQTATDRSRGHGGDSVEATPEMSCCELFCRVLSVVWNAPSALPKLYQEGCKGHMKGWLAYLFAVLVSVLLVSLAAWPVRGWLFSAEQHPVREMATVIGWTVFYGAVCLLECMVCRAVSGHGRTASGLTGDLVMGGGVCLTMCVAAAAVMVLQSLLTVSWGRLFPELSSVSISPLWVRGLQFFCVCMAMANVSAIVRLGLVHHSSVRQEVAVWWSGMVLAVSTAPFCIFLT